MVFEAETRSYDSLMHARSLVQNKKKPGVGGACWLHTGIGY